MSDDERHPLVRDATDEEQRQALVAHARMLVQTGMATHECNEWRDQGRCALCDRELPEDSNDKA